MERPRRALIAASACVIAAFAGAAFIDTPGTSRVFAHPTTGVYVRQVRFVLAMAGPQRAAPALADSPEMNGGLDGLAGADVLLAFVEVYGAVTYDNPTFAEALDPSRRDLAEAARETGREVLSAYANSPTFGASSWLAHLSLLTGVEVRDQGRIRGRDELHARHAAKGLSPSGISQRGGDARHAPGVAGGGVLRLR